MRWLPASRRRPGRTPDPPPTPGPSGTRTAGEIQAVTFGFQPPPPTTPLIVVHTSGIALEGKELAFLDWKGPKEALSLIDEAMDRYTKKQ